MSYIINSTNPFVSVKLTDAGRKKLALGALNFSYWAVGDSEIDYKRESIIDANPTNIPLSGNSIILSPVDRQPNIKYYVSTGDTVLNALTPDKVRTIKSVVNNKANERGFFSGSTNNYNTLVSNNYVITYGVIDNTNFTGGTSIDIATGISESNIIVFKLTNDTLGSIPTLTNDTPIPTLFYKVKSVAGSIITLDRVLPDFSLQSSTNIGYYVYPGDEVADAFGTGMTSAYWDMGTLSFALNNLVSVADNPVWCMNNTWSETVLGITGTTYQDFKHFGSYQYLGDKEAYFDYNLTDSITTQNDALVCDGSSFIDTGLKSVALIHYTNNTISNFYGEFFYINGSNGKQFELELPTLMYHRRSYATGSGNTMGMKFIASGTTKVLTNTDIEYVDLIEDPTMVSGKTSLTIGRVYPQLKMVSIHDDEIVAAMSYKSNRNWTLPTLKTKTKSPEGGASNGVLDVNKTIYITYAIDSTSGLTMSLPCQKFAKLTNNTPTSKDVEFHIEDLDLLPYMRKIEDVSYDGKGFYGDKLKLIYQIKDNETDRPTSDGWKVADFTTSAITVNINETIDPKKLEIQSPTTNGFILTNAINMANSGNTYTINQGLNIPLKTNTNDLNFGDERFFYGNIKTYIGANIYKTIFNITLSNSNFKQTSNPTRIAGDETPLRVTEIGVYDSTQELIAIGKVSEPIKLINGDTIMVELSLDF